MNLLFTYGDERRFCIYVREQDRIVAAYESDSVDRLMVCLFNDHAVTTETPTRYEVTPADRTLLEASLDSELTGVDPDPATGASRL